LPLLMVTKFKYDITPKFSGREIKAHPVKYIIIFIVIVLIIATKGDGLFIFCLFYLSTGIFRGVKNWIRRLLRPSRSSEENLKVKTTNL
jgi:hypothetical protein